LPPDTLRKKRVFGEDMQQSQLTTSIEIAEVRTVPSVAACNQLLADGWVLLSVIPLTTVGAMGARQAGDGEQDKRIEDTQRYVRRLVGYVVGKQREG
jgi:hypothetical protein